MNTQKGISPRFWSGLLLIILVCSSLSAVRAAPPVPCTPGTVPDPNGICVLDAVTHPKFVNPCPNPLDPAYIFQPTTGTHYDIGVYQITQDLGIVNPATLVPYTNTTVWGYGTSAATATYPGKTFVLNSGSLITVTWTNNLGTAATPLSHVLPVDSTLDWADPFNDPPNRVPGPYLGPVPIVTHLHGGHTTSLSDGLPDAWFTPENAYRGRLFNPTYTYGNAQESACLWYHDHALGITRLNVYMGLAGFYILRDANEAGLNLPQYPYEVPLVIQDRMFDANGQLYYPTLPSLLPLGAPSAQPEFFGEFILVNGKAWPVLNVEPRLYRLRLLNGSDSRFYNMALYNKVTLLPGPPIVQIGTDGGFLNAPVTIAWPNKLLMGPGERMDVLVDFSAFAGQTLTLINDARSPYPKGATVNPNTTGMIMQFTVAASPVTPGTIPATLRTAISPLTTTLASRQLILGESINSYGRLEPLLGTVAGGMLQYRNPITENPALGTNEIWEIYNTTPDSHPVHLHLVQFQIIDRQDFKATIALNGALTNIKLQGKPTPPAFNEAGWKDTVVAPPGQRTRIIANFDMLGEYVWHCHILSHEDHEMMRPFLVIP